MLYLASQAGVRVHLRVRRLCCLRPGVQGVSENIRLTSVIGRFLGHSRIFYFRNGGEEQIYMRSADLVPRNLDRRVEIVFPVEDAKLVRRSRDEGLEAYLKDSVNEFHVRTDGSYERASRSETVGGVDVQSQLMKR